MAAPFNGASAQNIVSDSNCRETDVPTLRLKQAVSRSPHRATPEIGRSVIDVYTSYIDCANNYKRHGNVEMFMYAIAQCSNLFQFAARNADALGDDESALKILLFGQRTLDRALTVIGGQPEYRSQIRAARREVGDLIKKMSR